MKTAIQKAYSLLTLRGSGPTSAGNISAMQCVADALRELGVHPYMVHSDAVYFTTKDQLAAYRIHCAVMEASKDGLLWILAAFFPRHAPVMPRDWCAGDLGYCVNPVPTTVEMPQPDLLIAAQALAQQLLRINKVDWTTPFARALGFVTVT